MAEEEAQAGLVDKGKDYPKTTAKAASTTEYSKTYRLHVWPPTLSEEDLAKHAAQLQADARAEGLVPARTVDVIVDGEGGITFVTCTTRVKKAKESL
jgi:hypothetical protein